MADFSDIKKEECLVKALPKEIQLTSSHTIVLQSVINAIKEHGRSSMHKEVCGVLVGNLCWDREAYLRIDARIEGKYADHQAGSVTFTSETWDHIHAELAAKYPEKKIVGWYHTHPGFGIFLSNMDFFIHENFFSLRWQPAYVFDPQAETEGFFFWHDKELTQEKVSVVPDEPAVKHEAPRKVVGKTIRIALEKPQRPSSTNAKHLKAILTVLLVLVNCMALYLLYNTIQNTRREFQSLSQQQDGEVQKLKKEGRSRQEELERIREQNRQDREREQQVRRDELEQSRKERLADQEQLINELQQQIASLKRSIAEQGSKASDEIIQLQDELKEVTSQCDEATRKLDEAHTSVEDLGNTCEALRTKIAQLEKAAQEARERAEAEALQREAEKVKAAEAAKRRLELERQRQAVEAESKKPWWKFW